MGRGAQAGRARLKNGPLKGGGASGGSLDIGETASPVTPVRSRAEILADRAATSQQTVGDALHAKLLTLSDKQIPEQAAVLQTVLKEGESGNTRAVQPYAYALQKLFTDDPERWMKLQQATGIEPAEFASRFRQEVMPGAQPSAQLQRLGGELAAQDAAPAPPAAPTRADFPWRWSMFLGGSEAAKPLYLDSRPAGSTRALYPELKSHETIRVLRDMTGFPFTPTMGRGMNVGSDPTVRAAMDLIEKNIDINPDMKRDPKLLARLRDEAGGDDRMFQSLLDQQPISTYDPALKDQVNQIFQNALADRPMSSDSMISRAVEGDLDPEDPNFAAYQSLDDDGNPLPVPMVRPMMADSADPPFPLGGPIRLSTASDRAMGLSARSPLDKRLEQIDAILEGRGSVPKPLQRLLNDPRNKNSDLRDMIYQNAVAGGVIDMDNLPYPWRQDFVAPDSADNGLYLGTLPPDILSTLLAQQLGKYDPRYIQSLVPHMQRSMDLYQQIKPTGRAQKYLKSIEIPTESGNKIPPAPIGDELLKAIQKFYQQRNLPIPPLQRRTPVTPNMTSMNSVMPQQSMMAADRINPLAALVG